MTMYELIEKRKLSEANVQSCAVYLGERLVCVLGKNKFDFVEVDEFMCQLQIKCFEESVGEGFYFTSFYVNFDSLMFSVRYNPKDDETSNN